MVTNRPASTQVHTVETSNLGDRSYVVTSGDVAIVVDPQRDIDRVLELVKRQDVRITHVFETHLHNDYVTGGLALARQTGATYVVPGDDTVAFDRRPAYDNDIFEIRTHVVVRAIHTPGHTPHHTAYVVEESGHAVAVFTGGSMLFGTTGRTDLIAAELTASLTHDQFNSVHRLTGLLPDEVAVYPTHGFGSFCSATPTSGDASTIGEQRRVNMALTHDEQHFVSTLLAALDAYPAYYAFMAPRNAAGPEPADLSPVDLVDAAELRRRTERGEWLVDLRSRHAFAAGHLPGSYNFEASGNVVTYLGWTVPWGTPITLLAANAGQVADVQRELVRIGIDRPAGAAVGDPLTWSGGQPLRSYQRVTFADLAQAAPHRDHMILDVRRINEWHEQAIAGALHIPLHELLDRLDEVPSDTDIWVHCASGFRASIAASFLDAAGRRVVAIDDDFTNVAAAGLATGGGGGAPS